MEEKAKQRIGNVKIFDSLRFKLALFLYNYPMKDSKYKIYEKLEPNQKMGMLMSHLKGTARKLGVSPYFIKMFEEAQDDYKFYKKNGERWMDRSLDQMRSAKFTEEGGSARFIDAHEEYVRMKHRTRNTVVDLGHITKKMLMAVLKYKNMDVNLE